MRNRGERLSIAQLKASPLVRGHLGVFVRRDYHRGGDAVCALLEGDLAGQFRLPVLDHMRLTRMRGESFVLVGFEESSSSKRPARCASSAPTRSAL
jgi:hypothetical protein